ncbi:type II toxin-antitoxin system Phd/YefM family antitoxin [Cryptosporangium phraense]|uniref:Antitoxin n=1 Tax=Cryptosporangium phraense TaxID=2593070 RepID=A0A545ASD7_9ACTN|nr:type II toxin-antitoxin system Phd/YefM family antitoxin [Cryptosporangium phraense]TQS44240.1 hypothetical protein FL583_14975 [Cryptosporangium phraense]
MSTVSIREFSHNPSAMFARAEKGETIEVTRHGNVIAILVPGDGWHHDRYASLIADGTLRLGSMSTSDIDQITTFEVPPGVEPLDILLAAREEEDR